MNELAKSDVFFVITSLSVIVLTVIVAILLIYVFVIVKDIKGIVRNVKEESDDMISDFKELRFKIKSEEGMIRRTVAFSTFLAKIFMKRRGGKSKAKKKNTNVEKVEDVDVG